MGKYTKSKFVMKVSYLEPEGEGFKVVDTQTSICRGSDFSTSLALDKARGIKREIQFVTKEPTTFQRDGIYILLEGSKVWVSTNLLENTESKTT